MVKYPNGRHFNKEEVKGEQSNEPTKTGAQKISIRKDSARETARKLSSKKRGEEKVNAS